jgi:hypothetical protein
VEPTIEEDFDEDIDYEDHRPDPLATLRERLTMEREREREREEQLMLELEKARQEPDEALLFQNYALRKVSTSSSEEEEEEEEPQQEEEKEKEDKSYLMSSSPQKWAKDANGRWLDPGKKTSGSPFNNTSKRNWNNNNTNITNNDPSSQKKENWY